MYKLLFFILFTISSYAQEGKSKNVFVNGKQFDFKSEVKKCKQVSYGVITYLDLIGRTISKNDTILIYEKTQKSKPYVRKDIIANNYNRQKELGKKIQEFLKIEIPHGKSVFLHFAFAKCPPCRKEIPLIEEIYWKHKEDFEFIVITPENDIEELKSLFSIDVDIRKLLAIDIDFRFGIRDYPHTMIFNEKNELQFVLNEIQNDFMESYLYDFIFK